ncbi:hypothetical protein IU405_07555 [Polaribacter sp. BAL334]|uniref:hypothetical protein n=1 Tax=Polaribacter sp. BAL334 TaxID=1708178 RepID=UPI0018D22055|nr:hypothetical protein [Polaribacter sp. BAL334]MBG7612102.1 hypothetical protein [Polaribacter sp. BAL334]
MKTGNKEYIRAIYVLDSSIELTDKKREYILAEKNNNLVNEVLKNRIKIEKDNGFHDRSREFEYWLYFRNDTNWSRCYKTGLAKTSLNYIFEGNVSEPIILKNKTAKGKDHENPKHFVLLQFSKNGNEVIIDLFMDFYPFKKALIELIIKEHQFYF